MALRLAIDLDLIDIALAHNGPVTLGDFAQKSKADPNLLRMSSHPQLHPTIAITLF
jgi:hypothetical protein